MQTGSVPPWCPPPSLKDHLGNLLLHQGKHGDAEAVYRDTLERQRAALGPEHKSTLLTAGNLAGALQNQGKYAEAEPLVRDTLAIQQRVLGEGHLQTLHTAGTLTVLLTNTGQHAAAEELGRGALAQAQRTLAAAMETCCKEGWNTVAALLQGSYNPDTTTSIQRLASQRGADYVLTCLEADCAATNYKKCPLVGASLVHPSDHFGLTQAQLDDIVRMLAESVQSGNQQCTQMIQRLLGYTLLNARASNPSQYAHLLAELSARIADRFRFELTALDEKRALLHSMLDHQLRLDVLGTFMKSWYDDSLVERKEFAKQVGMCFFFHLRVFHRIIFLARHVSKKNKVSCAHLYIVC